MHSLLLLVLPAALAAAPAPEAPARVSVGALLPRFARLVPGVHRYLRYTVKDGKRSAVDVWSRTLSFEQSEGRTLVHLAQRWDEARTPPLSVVQDSWFEPGTFRPLTHVRTVDRNGRIEVAGYRFSPEGVSGMAELPANVRRDFTLPASEPPFNFEYDIELLQALPLEAGYAASIPFYDPGLEPPARYVFRVEREDRIPAADGRPLRCWLVTADYNTGKVLSRFWIDRETQLLVREETLQPDGALMVKALLPAEAADGPAAAGPG